MSLCHKIKYYKAYIFPDDGVNLWNFKLKLFYLIQKYLRSPQWDAQIKRLENLSLWQRLNSFTCIIRLNFERNSNMKIKNIFPLKKT